MNLGAIAPPDLYGIDFLGLAELGEAAEALALAKYLETNPAGRPITLVTQAQRPPDRCALVHRYPEHSSWFEHWPLAVPGIHEFNLGPLRFN